jgi:dynein heavy chain
MSLIVKTLTDMNASKFVSEDVKTFSGLLNDVFPPMGNSNEATQSFFNALKEVCTEENLEMLPSWREKCLQLYESSIVRHGLMVVGPPRSGKSSIVNAVTKALCRMGSKTHVWRMNPKSITAPQMFGKLDHSTGDWTDGIFSMLWKRAAKAAHSVWIVVDGPVDAVWIENLNTVLDDNKVLTLANGDRVRMLSSMRLVFETENLDNASPATVSRAGVVYMSPNALGWRPLLSSFLNSQGIQSTILQGWIESMISAATRSVNSCSYTSVPGEIILAQNFMTLLGGYFSLFPKSRESFINWKDESKFDGGVLGITLFCIVWGFSGPLPNQDRLVFANAFRKQANELCSFPDIHIYDVYYDSNSNKWRPWNDILDALDPEKERVPPDDFFTASVHTTEGTRMIFLLNLIHAAGKTPHVRIKLFEQKYEPI